MQPSESADESAYDLIAPDYDRIEDDPAFKQMRAASFAVIAQSFRQGQIVIDIGCGTGTEAIALGRRGVTVVGIDPSEEMVKIARQKARAAKMSTVSFYRLSARDLKDLPKVCGFHRFDGAYSSFGSLNNEPILEPVRDALMDLLAPGSLVVVSLINRVCAIEMLAYLFTRPSKVFRRRAPFIEVPIADKRVMMRVYSNREIVRSFHPMKHVSSRAINVLVPPPGLARRIPEDVLGFLSRIEEPMAGVWPLDRVGDYTQLTFQKRQASVIPFRRRV